MNIAHASIFKRQWFKVGVSLIFTFVFLAMSFLPIAVSSFQKPVTVTATNDSSINVPVALRTEAGWPSLFCRGFGYNMEGTSSWGRNFGDLPLEDKTNRRFTIQEAFGNSLKFVSYYGEGEGETFVQKKESDPPSFVSVDKARLESQRTVETCFFSRALIGLGSGALQFADSLTMISQFIVSKVFDPNLVCNRDSTSVNDDSCLDLVSVIGGESDDDDSSIIGSLTNSVYFPLITIAAIFVGFTVFYQGIVQRKVREAFGGLIWCGVVVILGGIAVLNPVLLTKAPMNVSSVAASCVLGAFSGQNCLGGTHDSVSFDGGLSDSGKSGSELVCASSASGTGYTDQMQLTLGSVSCQIWKSFVLNPYAIASFGAPFDDLDTKDPDAKGREFVAAASGVDSEDFCVNLSSTQSASDMKYGTLELNSTSNGGRVCNIAAYQLYLMTNAESTGDGMPESGELDERWYKIVEVAGNNDSMWTAWTSSAMSKVGISLVSAFVTTAGNLVIFVTGIYALVYYISGIILMAFAPIFLLIGIHPGRGKRIMLGWLEKVISNVLKYIISAAFVVVTVGIYGGVLAANAGLAMTIIFVIIVTMALMMYRKEFTEMLGRANMGGEQLSNNMSEYLGSKAKKAGDEGRQLIRAGAGGAIGSKFAGGTVKGGFSAGVKRDLKRGTGFVANTAREFDNVKNSNRRNIEGQIARGHDLKKGQREEDLKQVLGQAGYSADVTPLPGGPMGGPVSSPVGTSMGGRNADDRRTDAQNLENEMDKANRDYDYAKQDMAYAEGKEQSWNSYVDARNDISVELKNDEVLLDNLLASGRELSPDLSDSEILSYAHSTIDMFIEHENLTNEDRMLSGQINALNALGRTDQVESLEARRSEIHQRTAEIDDMLSPEVSQMMRGRLNSVAEQNGVISPEAQEILGKIDRFKTKSEPEVVDAFDNHSQTFSELNEIREAAAFHRDNGDEQQALDLEAAAESHMAKLKDIESSFADNENFAQMTNLRKDLHEVNHSTDIGESIEHGIETSTTDKFTAGEKLVVAKSAIDALSVQKAQVEETGRENNTDVYDDERIRREQEFNNHERERVARTRSDIELENAEDMLVGLHPDEGLTRRKLNKLRKQAGKELVEEGYIEPVRGITGEQSHKQYARKRARQDVRGEKLYDDSRGTPIVKEQPNNQQEPVSREENYGYESRTSGLPVNKTRQESPRMDTPRQESFRVETPRQESQQAERIQPQNSNPAKSSKENQPAPEKSEQRREKTHPETRPFQKVTKPESGAKPSQGWGTTRNKPAEPRESPPKTKNSTPVKPLSENPSAPANSTKTSQGGGPTRNKPVEPRKPLPRQMPRRRDNPDNE